MLALHVAHARCVTIVPHAVVQLGLAGLAGALGAICVYPIDLVKTRLQSTVGGTSYGNAFEVVDEMMTNEGGLPALFKGIRPQLVGVVPEKTIKLFVHDAAVLACGEAASGFLAGGCQVVVTNPLEVVKVRMQLSPDGGLRVSDVVSELGLRGLYTGVARPRLALNLRPGPRLSSSP
jgi:solute carrier family 25 aspartate/glutamate transporter 12/13